MFKQSGEKSYALCDWRASHQLLNTWDHGTCMCLMENEIVVQIRGLLPAKTRLVRIYWWLRHEIGIISPTEEDTVWAKLMSIIEMKLPHPTALLHPSRIHPLASRLNFVVVGVSVGSMTSLQATAVSQWVLNILGWSINNDITMKIPEVWGRENKTEKQI